MPESQIVKYRVNDSTVAHFEIDPGAGFRPAAGVGEIVTDVRSAVGPAVDAARAVLDRVRPLGSEVVEVRFGVKVSGSADWLVAKSADEGAFEITLAWRTKD